MEIKSISWDEALPIRHKVLWPNKPLLFCKVDADETAQHYGVYSNNQLVCVASIYLDGRAARLRKFATLAEFQGQGIGSTLIAHILKALKTTNINKFWCDARITAIGFYKKFGMEQHGSQFNKSSEVYVKMEVML